MPLVTVDTSVALPATLSPRSHPRKLFVMLAFGALTYRAEHLRLDADALRHAAASEGGGLAGLAALEGMIEQAERRRSALGELLPYDAPDDWVAAGFSALFDEFGRKLIERGHRLDPAVRDEDVPRLRRQFEAICVCGPPPFDASDVPPLTRDPQDDPIVYGALLAGADFLVSDDRDIVPSGEEHDYEHEEHRLRAVTFGHFANTCFAGGDFAWSEVDGTWLRLAWEPHDDRGT